MSEKDEAMVISFPKNAKIHKGTFDADVKKFYKRPTAIYYSDDHLLELVKKETGEGKKKKFSLKNALKSKSDPIDYNDITEEKINREIEELTEDDFEDMSGMVIAAIDWILEKVLNNFFNRQQVKETPAQKQKLKRLKILGKKMLAKWGVKFKIEMLFLVMFIGYVSNRYSSAEIIDESKVKEKKKRRFFSKNVEKNGNSNDSNIIDITSNQNNNNNKKVKEKTIEKTIEKVEEKKEPVKRSRGLD